MPRKIEKYSNI